MKTRIALTLGLILAVTPASVVAQTDSPAPEVAGSALVDQLCAASAADDAELTSCVEAVKSALEQMSEQAPPEELDLLAQAQALVDDTQALIDETLEDVQEIDVQAAIDEAVAQAQEFELDVDLDVQGALDDIAAAAEDLDFEDVQTAIDEAVAEALAATEDIDLEGAIEEALAEAQAAIDDAELDEAVGEAVAALGESVDEARAVVAAAQVWAVDNKDAVCRGGSVSLGTTVGVAVFALTGVEWLGLQAFWATERFTNSACGDFVE
jgi:hypothetical protein